MTNDAVRRRPAPHRNVGDRCIVARPADGDPLLLDPVSALVWGYADQWRTVTELDELLGADYPTVDDAERRNALADIVESLLAEGLVERRP